MANNTALKCLKKADLLRVTKIPEPTFEHWIDRKLIELNRDDVAGAGKGRPNLYGHRTAKKLAIAHKAVNLGIPANTSVKLAEKFADLPQHGRPLGGLFPEGTTYILVTPDRGASVVNVKPLDDVSHLLTDATIILNVNKIISEINFEIGIIK
jgi:hypothetical protein